MAQFKDHYRLILKEIDGALTHIDETTMDRFATMIVEAEKVFVVGVGRVMLSLQAFVKRLNHIGIKAWSVGDINEPAITDKDLLVVGSGSGESIFPLGIARCAKQFNAKLIHIGSNPQSSLSPLTDLMVRIPVKTKLNLPEEIDSQQIMSSLFEQSLYILCDAVALKIVEQQGLDLKSLWRFHANLE